ncbi:unnamed protein product [Auanema sp. JU1783]|nr:unnamed protein product [Auanema sp. JU1783]
MKKNVKEKDDTQLLINRHNSDDIGKLEDDTNYHATSPNFHALPHIFNLVNCIVGVSVLAMPFCFQQCGILLTVIMIAFCSILTKVTCHFLTKISFSSRKRSYEALALAGLGSTGRRFVEISLLLFLMSSVVAYIVVIGDIGPHVVADYLELEAPTSRLRTLVLIVIMLFVVFPLCWIKDLETFSVLSSAAVLFYAVFVVRMLGEALPVLYDGKWSMNVVWWRPEGFLKCLPIIAMALSCQTQLFCVMQCMKDPSAQKVEIVVSSAINFCSAMYAAVGLFGYVAFFAKDLHGDVLVELESSFLTEMLKLAFMLSIALSIPLMLFPTRSAMYNLLLRDSGCDLPSAFIDSHTFHILTVIILGSNVMVALLIPNVEFVLGLTGSLIGSLVTTIIPSVLYLSLIRRGSNLTTVAKLCMIVGFSIMLGSTWATLSADQRSSMVEKPVPKDSVVDPPALKSLERLEEKVLDTNLNISQKLDDIANFAAKGDQQEAARLIVEMKEQQEEQVKLIKKQEEIVEELNKHVEKHKIASIENNVKLEKSLNNTEEEEKVRQ